MRRTFLVGCLLFLCPEVMYSQKPTDTELWTGGALNLRLSKAFRMEVEEQLRFKDTVSSLKNALTEIGLRYKLNKYFAFKGNTRWISRPGKKNRYRLSLDAYFRWSKKKFPLSASYRLRFQNTHTFISRKNSTYLRNKISLDYNLSRIVDPFCSYELYYRFNAKNEFRVKRFTFGMDWRLHKRMHLATFYRIQDKINIKVPERQNIFGFMLTYRIKLN